MEEIRRLRHELEKGFKFQIPEIIINSPQGLRLPNTSRITFPKVGADVLLVNLPDIMLGTGSACSSGTIEPSHVLQAIGISREDAQNTIRASLGRFTTKDEINRAIEIIGPVCYSLIHS